MARAARFFRIDDIAIVNQARANLESTRDSQSNALDEAALIAEVERLMPFDPAMERRRKAAKLVKDQERPRKTEANGSLWLPGFDKPYPYEPNQLMPDGDGRTVERDKATPHFVTASLTRKQEHVQKAQAALARAQSESDGFAEWATDQAINGRAANEITMGNFVREKGYWSSEPTEDEPDDDGGE